MAANNDANTPSDQKNEEHIKQFLQKQALDELSKARPVATVFFRFSHRDENDEFMLVHKQKEDVDHTRKTILEC